MISIRNVLKTYDNFHALNNIYLEIYVGQFVALVGASGSGKSTLLNMIGLIDIPTEGQIFIKEQETNKMSDNDKAELRNKFFGFIFQSFYLENRYTVEKNIEIPLIIRGIKSAERKILVKNALETVGLLSKIKNLAGTLSGGEMQRVAIARAIAGSPQIILADEPCGNLDTKNSEIVLELFKKLHAMGKTIVLVTHNLEHAKIADRVVTLSDGEIISDEKKH